MHWSIEPVCWATASAWASGLRRFALAAASIGAATLRFAAAARSTGAARSSPRSTFALTSRSDRTSLSGSGTASCASISSIERLCSPLARFWSFWTGSSSSFMQQGIPGAVAPTNDARPACDPRPSQRIDIDGVRSALAVAGRAEGDARRRAARRAVPGLPRRRRRPAAARARRAGRGSSIGRAAGNDVVLDWDRQVSRSHAQLERIGARLDAGRRRAVAQRLARQRRAGRRAPARCATATSLRIGRDDDRLPRPGRRVREHARRACLGAGRALTEGGAPRARRAVRAVPRRPRPGARAGHQPRDRRRAPPLARRRQDARARRCSRSSGSATCRSTRSAPRWPAARSSSGLVTRADAEQLRPLLAERPATRTRRARRPSGLRQRTRTRRAPASADGRRPAPVGPAQRRARQAPRAVEQVDRDRAAEHDDRDRRGTRRPPEGGTSPRRQPPTRRRMRRALAAQRLDHGNRAAGPHVDAQQQLAVETGPRGRSGERAGSSSGPNQRSVRRARGPSGARRPPRPASSSSATRSPAATARLARARRAGSGPGTTSSAERPTSRAGRRGRAAPAARASRARRAPPTT